VLLLFTVMLMTKRLRRWEREFPAVKKVASDALEQGTSLLLLIVIRQTGYGGAVFSASSARRHSVSSL
jgi:hypothetical protein